MIDGDYSTVHPGGGGDDDDDDGGSADDEEEGNHEDDSVDDCHLFCCHMDMATVHLKLKVKV